MTFNRGEPIGGTTREWYIADAYSNMYFVTLPLVNGGPATCQIHAHRATVKQTVTIQLDHAPSCYNDDGHYNTPLTASEKQMLDHFCCQIDAVLQSAGLLVDSRSPAKGHIR